MWTVVALAALAVTVVVVVLLVRRRRRVTAVSRGPAGNPYADDRWTGGGVTDDWGRGP